VKTNWQKPIIGLPGKKIKEKLKPSSLYLNNFMFNVRSANENDYTKIYALYKAVAAEPIGIARSPEEVTELYIKDFMKDAEESGIELVIEHPDNPETIIADIHCHTPAPKKFHHILSDLTIAVHPDFQGKGAGKKIFVHLLDYITNNRPDILRVELFVQESNERAIAFYKKIGFVPEGRFEKRIPGGANILEADIPMVWFNAAYSGK
jgi:ribosomal protein S18 acetylase RimI-like enzyme